jgi:hypothetical protein
VSTEIARTVNATVPSIRLLAGCLGIMLSEKDIKEIGSGMFPRSLQELFIAHLTEDICRAYSGDVQPLTTDFLIGKVSRLVPFNSFQLERELKQCAACCVPMYDDLRPHTALLALDSSRHLNNRYQAVFGVVLTIEVLARLVKYNASLRFEFDELSWGILYNSYNTAAQFIENRIADILESEELKKQIEHDLEAAFSAQFSGGHNG